MLRTLPGITLAFLTVPALAGELSYNYVELGYQRVDVDDVLPGVNVDGDGFGIRGSVEINESWFIAGAYSQTDFDFGADNDLLSFGAGYHAAIAPRVDVFTILSYITAEASANGFSSIDDDGYGASVGVRGLVGDRIELVGRISYVDLGGSADGTSYGAGALYSFTDTFALGIEFDVGEDATAYGVGARFYFGT